ncbi:MAG: hypothetical protein EBX55_11140, partial [Betaproteobacteria bacterium]|nr:hypothetical protein [Betaproteobacteria bacterium]
LKSLVHRNFLNAVKVTQFHRRATSSAHTMDVRGIKGIHEGGVTDRGKLGTNMTLAAMRASKNHVVRNL